MSAKLFLGISAVVAVAYGIGFLFAPEALMSAYGVAINPSAIMEVRFWGATLTGLGIMYWLVRGSADLTALRGILYGFSIANIAGIWVAYNGTMAGTMNSVGWSAVGVYALLLLGCIVTLLGLSRQPLAA